MTESDRAQWGISKADEAVFPARSDTWQQVNNVGHRWRQIRKDTGLDWAADQGAGAQPGQKQDGCGRSPPHDASLP